MTLPAWFIALNILLLFSLGFALVQVIWRRDAANDLPAGPVASGLTGAMGQLGARLIGLSDRAVLESLNDALVLTDSDGIIVYCNQETERRFALDVRDIVGNSLRRLTGIDPLTTDEDVLTDVVHEFSGVRYRHDVLLTRLKRGDGKPMMYAVVFEDRSQLRENLDRLAALQDRLLDQENELGVLDEAKKAFIAGAADDMREPLADLRDCARQLAGCLEARGDAPDSLNLVNDIQVSAEHLWSVIDDLGHFEVPGAADMLQLAEADVSQLVSQVVRQFRAQFAAAGVTLKVDNQVNQMVTLDEQRFSQMLINLVTNALKFTPSGGSVTIRSRLHQGHLVVDVIDTGVGIAEDDQQRIFSAFEQAEPSVSRVSYTPSGSGGTGLGLPLVRRLAQAHGGDVEVLSQPGRGSTFRIQLPLDEPDEPQWF